MGTRGLRVRSGSRWLPLALSLGLVGALLVLGPPARAASIVVNTIADSSGARGARAAHATVFTNGSGISIPSASGFGACFINPSAPPEVTAASPYPSQISVSDDDLDSVQDVNVTVSLGVILGFGGGIGGGDLDILLVGPSGASTILTADNGYDYGASNVVLTFDDEAAATLPNFPAPLQTGTYKPSINTLGGNSCTHPASFPAPAPAGPYGTPSLTVFDGSNPNGAWGLFVISDTARNGAVGSIASWSLDITADEIQDPFPAPPPPGAVIPAPDVLSMSPVSGPVGTVVTISGTNLSSATVRFNGVLAPLSSNTASQIMTTVPQGATTGPVMVSTPGGSDLAGTFTVTTTPPQVTGFSPSQGKVGTQVVISGTGFTGTAVSFGGVPAAFVMDSPTQITATVPPGAGTGPIAVTTGAGNAQSAQAFVVTHARSAGLHFSEARGSVSVADGWSSCAANVLVRLQLKVTGGFRTVASASTTAHGSYRFGGVQEGSYRVVAKKVTLPSGDVCLRAASAVVMAA